MGRQLGAADGGERGSRRAPLPATAVIGLPKSHAVYCDHVAVPRARLQSRYGHRAREFVRTLQVRVALCVCIRALCIRPPTNLLTARRAAAAQLGKHRMERGLRRVRRVAAAFVDGRGSSLDCTRAATDLAAATDRTMAESTAAGCHHAHRTTCRIHSMHGCALTSRVHTLATRAAARQLP